MSDMSRAEAMKAAREARDRDVSTPRTSKAGAVEAAMKRYLSAEQYHELHELHEEERAAEKDSTEHAD